MPITLAAHSLRRRPRSLALRLRVAEKALALVLAAVEGRIPQVRR